MKPIGVLIMLLFASPAFGQGSADVAALKKEYEDGRMKHLQEMREARDKGLDRSEWPKDVTPAFFERFKAFADKNAGTPAAAEALEWMFQYVRAGVPREKIAEEWAVVLDKLMKDHAKDPMMASVAQSLDYGVLTIGPTGTEALRTLIKVNEHDAVKSWAIYSLAFSLASQGVNTTPEDKAESKKLLDQLVAKYPDSDAAKRGRPIIFESSHLQIGQTPPDFETEDTDGKKFKLSDYRGKVVVLDFWGFWAGACVEMIPHEKTLVERLKDKPFALIGINTDQDKDVYRKKADEMGVSWRSSWQGSTKGPIPELWNVHSFPTIYVLDHKGVVRCKNVRGKDMDKAVDTLLAEMR